MMRLLSCHASLFLLLYVLLAAVANGFSLLSSVQKPHPAWIGVGASKTCSRYRRQTALFSDASPGSSASTGRVIQQWLLDLALQSPLWTYVLVPQARKKIAQTAQDNGIDWKRAYDWLTSQEGPWNDSTEKLESLYDISPSSYPSYYMRPFHAYEDGNLCWESAMESELASCAVGARNFPLYGSGGEEAFRSAFEATLVKDLDVTVPGDATLVDVGCGTGVSTRRLAKNWPQAGRIVGVDMSPYFVAVGKRLLELSPKSMLDENAGHGGTWVHSIEEDERIEYHVGDATRTALPDAYADVVNIQFVVHELPHAIAKLVILEAYRLLKPGGQLWLCEMDFEAPAYAKQRANALLFALIRATEPSLDEYAESERQLLTHVGKTFETTTVTAATGRHFALVAVKARDESGKRRNGTVNDLRFRPDGTYRVEDTHLKVWENKQE